MVRYLGQCQCRFAVTNDGLYAHLEKVKEALSIRNMETNTFSSREKLSRHGCDGGLSI